VELSHIRVTQCLLRRQTLVRVKLEQVLQKIECVVRGRREHVSESFGLGCGQGFEHGRGEGRVDRVDVFGRGTAGDFHHTVELVQGRGAREDGLSEQELSKDTSHTPHVNALGVLVGSEQDLGRSVPPSSHVISEQGLLVDFLIQGTGETEICDLDVALRVEKQVGRFQISVEEVGGVHELETFQHLVDDVLFVDVFEDVGADNGVEICVHKVKH